MNSPLPSLLIRLTLLLAVILVPAAGPLHAAKNIIIMVADGWGFNHIEATSYYQHGKLKTQPYESFPVARPMSTQAADGAYDPAFVWSNFDAFNQDAADSAGTATTLSTGYKTLYGRIGVDPKGEPLKHIAQRAQELGKASGVVTSVQISHATPASFSVHVASRSRFEEIGYRMITESGLDVIMGAGHPWFDDDGQRVETPDFRFVGGRQIWEAVAEGRAGAPERPWTLIESREDFLRLARGESAPERVIGLAPVRSTLQHYRAGGNRVYSPEEQNLEQVFETPFITTVPALAEMTSAALNVLSRNPRGFLLNIEGGAIDWAGHRNQSARMIEEMIDFSDAVSAVVAWIEQNSNWEETLLIVTGDHETGYLNGPGSGPDAQPHWKPIVNRGAGNLPGMEWHSTRHTNRLIPLFAKGAGAQGLASKEAGVDPVHGPYIDNTAVGLLMHRVLK